MLSRPLLNSIPIHTRRINRVIRKRHTRPLRIPRNSPHPQVRLADESLAQRLDAVIDVRREVPLQRTIWSCALDAGDLVPDGVEAVEVVVYVH